MQRSRNILLLTTLLLTALVCQQTPTVVLGFNPTYGATGLTLQAKYDYKWLELSTVSNSNILRQTFVDKT
jgi:hypothetical protein